MNPSTTSPHTHADLIEIRAHTVKCNSCNKHNELTIYRCIDCGQHECSPCRNKSEETTRVFGSGSRNVPESASNHKNAHGENGNKDAGETRAGRRVHVISDEKDDLLTVLTPTSMIGNTKTVGSSKQHQDSINVIMDNDHHHDHDGLPRLWPMGPDGESPALKPTEPARNTNAFTSPNWATQRNPHSRPEEMDLVYQRTVRVHDETGRQSASSRDPYIDDRATNPHVPPSQPAVPRQQMNHAASLHVQPAIYHPRPGTNVDQQAARNQLAFAKNRHTSRQAPRPFHPPIIHQQNARPLQFVIYRPQPGSDVDQQAADIRLPSTNDPSSSYQVPRPGQQAVSYQHFIRPTPLSVRDSIFVSQRPVQTATSIDQAALRSQQVLQFQNAQAYAAAKRMEASNRPTLSMQQIPLPAGNRDQLTAHNHQAFFSNRLSSFAAGHEKALAARGQQRSYLERPQVNRPTSSPAQASLPYTVATESARSQTRLVFPQQHEAILASHHGQCSQPTQDHQNEPLTVVEARQYSPELIEAADALLHYAGVEQNPRDGLNPWQDANGESNLLSAASLVNKEDSARPKSRPSPRTQLRGPGAAGPNPLISPNPTLNHTASVASASTESLSDGHRFDLAKSHSPQGTPNIILNNSAGQRGRPGHGVASLQSDSGSALAEYPAERSLESSIAGVRLQPDSKPPVSDQAATHPLQSDSDRAALSTLSKSTASGGSTPQPSHPRSPVHANLPCSIVKLGHSSADGSKSGEVANTDTRESSSAPVSVPRGPKDGDVMTGSVKVEILENDKSSCRSRARTPVGEIHKTIGSKERDGEKHPRDEKRDNHKASKEHKASDDIDVVDARKRNATAQEERKHIGQVPDDNDDDDDDSDDIQITSWNKLDSKKTSGNHKGGSTGAKEQKSGRRHRKGVAYVVKKSEVKTRKGKTTAAARRVG